MSETSTPTQWLLIDGWIINANFVCTALGTGKLPYNDYLKSPYLLIKLCVSKPGFVKSSHICWCVCVCSVYVCVWVCVRVCVCVCVRACMQSDFCKLLFFHMRLGSLPNHNVNNMAYSKISLIVTWTLSGTSILDTHTCTHLQANWINKTLSNP